MKLSVIYEPNGKAREYARLAANPYRGCGHGCVYCYVPAVLRMKPEEFHAGATLRPGFVEKFRRDCAKLSRREGVPPVLFSFTTDPYNPVEMSSPVMPEALAALHENGLAASILTKAGRLAERDFHLLTARDLVGTTLTFLDEDRSAEFEPYAQPPWARRTMLENAKELGLRTWVSLEPVLDAQETIRLIQATSAYVDLFRIGKANYRACDVDWVTFGPRVVEALEATGKPYYVKQDTKPLCSDGAGWTLDEVEAWESRG